MATYQRNMALDRDTFKDKVEEHLSGAIREFYKSRLSEKNGDFRWVDHWKKEAEDLIERSLAVYDRPIRGFRDQDKAFDEAVDYVKKHDRTYRRRATNTVRRDLKARRLRAALSDADERAFWRLVDELIEAQ